MTRDTPPSRWNDGAPAAKASRAFVSRKGYVMRESIAIALTALMLPAASSAAVTDVGAGGFVTETTVQISATPDRIFAALTKPALWWEARHTRTGNPANVTLAPTVGGCFCEALPSGGGQVYMTVIYVDPGKVLRMRGTLGPSPAQAMPIDGVMSWDFKPMGAVTEVKMTYSVSGYSKAGFDMMAKTNDDVLTAEVARLKRLIETGKPEE